MLNLACTSCRLTCFWFLKIALSVCVCVCVCPLSRLLLTSGVMWHDMNFIWLVEQTLQVFMAAVISIVSRYGLINDPHHRNQPNKSKLALCKPLLLLQQSFYISNKMEHFNYKSKCGVCVCKHIEVLKKKSWLGL